MKRWTVECLDVRGNVIEHLHFRTRRGARRWMRKNPPLSPFGMFAPLWTYRLVSTLLEREL